MDNFQDKWNSKQKSDSSHSDVLPLSVSSSMMTATKFFYLKKNKQRKKMHNIQLITFYAL